MDFEKGLDQLKQYATQKSWQGDFSIFESRLRENLDSEKLFGTSEQIRSDRARIVAQLNRLAQEQLEISFNDLCLITPSLDPLASSTADYEQNIGISPHQRGVFVCYSRRDKRYLNELQTHMAHYIRTEKISYWDDSKILPGAKWQKETQKALQNAQMAILLISANFFASDFIAHDELPVVLEAAKQQKITILCVIVRPCIFKDTELAQFQTVNDPSVPLSTMSYGKREMVWLQVAELVKDHLLAKG